jgi:hypothetical protein
VSTLTRANVLAFLNRDWAASRRSKDEALGRFVRTKGATAAFRLEQTLLDAVWPRINAKKARAADLADLIALRKKLAKATPRR